MATTTQYYARLDPAELPDQRAPCQRDRDRILYCSAFKRLSGVTQVVAPNEGHIFHNRLTHSLEVAQIARRIAEVLNEKQPRVAAWHEGIDEDAVEAAALAHDLGHPPFGHIAEVELDRLMRDDAHEPEGYEGNAQSFRIVTKLAVRSDDFRGLNLTRVTLNALLKYPWYRGPHGKEARKWGAYRRETEAFRFAREIYPDDSRNLSIEAEIMTWADDIAYSIHDTEDFYRAGLIPLDRVVADREGERARFLESVKQRWEGEGRHADLSHWDELSDVFSARCDLIPVSEPYVGTRLQRLALRSFTSARIGDYIQATKLQRRIDAPLLIDEKVRNEVKMFKELTWHYVIANPSLASQQFGQRRIVRELFAVYMDAANRASPAWAIFPHRFQQELKSLAADFGNDIPHDLRVRTVADTIATMTDLEALRIFQRFSGVLPGSVLEPLIR